MSRHEALATVAAPPLQVDAWLNTPHPLELARLGLLAEDAEPAGAPPA
ncbi:conserved hypothetical protein [Bordetella bronchiseptica MO211]|nr:conserved hypothetical protein [Bordetella bronchiseptica MO211]